MTDKVLPQIPTTLPTKMLQVQPALSLFNAPVNFHLENRQKKIRLTNEMTITLPQNKSASLTVLYKKEFTTLPFLDVHYICGDKMGGIQMIIEAITPKDFTLTLINEYDIERQLTIYYKAKN